MPRRRRMDLQNTTAGDGRPAALCSGFRAVNAGWEGSIRGSHSWTVARATFPPMGTRYSE